MRPLELVMSMKSYRSLLHRMKPVLSIYSLINIGKSLNDLKVEY
jgi:hypothetical protein